ncbi:MAG: sulfatase-like hydrolase/transferase [Rhodobacteraceae bacterium]|nr:sulfatase-like hydrolase/transferase [Paracoccaceae bacterium]
MRQGLALLLSAVVLHLVLVQPNHPDAVTWQALILFPLELPVLLLGLALLGDGRAGRWLRRGLAGLLVLVIAAKAADMAMFVAFGRGFNPVGDRMLAGAGVNLLTGSAGPVVAVAAVLGLVVLVGGLFWLLERAMATWARAGLLAQPVARRVAGGVALVMALVATYEVAGIMNRWQMPWNPPGAAFTARVAAEEVRLVMRSGAAMREFRAAAEADPLRGRTDLLDRIDRDVVVVFIESYGRASVEGPLFAETTQGVLTKGEAALAVRGVAMRSGYLASSTRGGQSWLAHATFASGLRVSDQLRYQALLASGREGLFHIAQRAGFETGAVMPAITMAWPEGEKKGFDRIFPAAELGYKGLPFNWVTMPDQYTLAAFDRLLGAAGEGRRFSQVVLISSHAPWVPVPRLVPWEEVGDGRIFDAMAQEGDPPAVVWRDRDRVRDQYRQSVAYSVEVVLDWLARMDPERMPLTFVLGDHQAAGFVAGEDRYDVPIHVIGPAALVERAADWGFMPGLVPPVEMTPLPMQAMRDRIVAAYSSAALP